MPYVRVPVVPWLVRGGSAGHERGTGWVWPGGYTGGLYRVLPSYPPTARGQPHTSEAGPGSPAGLEWVGMGLGRVSWGVRRRAGPVPPFGPGRSHWALPVQDPCRCRLWANKGEIMTLFTES